MPAASENIATRPARRRKAPALRRDVPDRAAAWSDNVRTTLAGARWSWRKRIGISCTIVLLAFFGGALAAFVYDHFEKRRHLIPPETMARVVERIVHAESRGDPNAKNPRSSATGAGQFIDATWLELIRRHRTDLTARSEAEILELRRDPLLAREMTARLIERNAAVLRARKLPLTPGTLYLSHFAGGAGAAAILQAKDDADAALVMALADSTGRTTREKIVKANPFLEGVTAAGLRQWADRKMIPAAGRM